MDYGAQGNVSVFAGEGYMSYESVVEQIKSVPEEYLDEISELIRFVLYRHQNEMTENNDCGGLGRFFGRMNVGDGLAVQREIRGEWD